MKFMRMGTVYKKMYIIRVLPTLNHTKWYYNKAGRVFECEIEHINKRPFFRIDHMHKIPTECCNIVETKTVILYKKY